MHRQESVWGADAGKYVPSRWLNQAPGALGWASWVTCNLLRKLFEKKATRCHHIKPCCLLLLSFVTAVNLTHFLQSLACTVRFAEVGGVRTCPAFMPFSLGPRDCAGQPLAMLELRAVLITLLGRLRYVRAGEGRRGIVRASPWLCLS